VAAPDNDSKISHQQVMLPFKQQQFTANTKACLNVYWFASAQL